MRTTTRTEWRFSFTISDLGRMLGKAPVTLRGWEAKGFIEIPRESSGDRKLTTNQVRDITKVARRTKRITTERANWIYAAMTVLELIENENNRKAKA